MTPGLTLALNARQRRELADALRQAPQPEQVLRQVRESLQQRRSIPWILEDLRANKALSVLRQSAAHPPGHRTALLPTDDPRDQPRESGSTAPVPKAI